MIFKLKIWSKLMSKKALIRDTHEKDQKKFVIYVFLKFFVPIPLPVHLGLQLQSPSPSLMALDKYKHMMWIVLTFHSFIHSFIIIYYIGNSTLEISKLRIHKGKRSWVLELSPEKAHSLPPEKRLDFQFFTHYFLRFTCGYMNNN